jgi:methyltransferase-like protein
MAIIVAYTGSIEAIKTAAHMQNPDEEWRPRRREDLLTQRVDDDEIVLDQQRQRVHQLNIVAAFILRHCDGEHTVADIVEAVHSGFEVDMTKAKKDVAAAVHQLQELGLVQ